MISKTTETLNGNFNPAMSLSAASLQSPKSKLESLIASQQVGEDLAALRAELDALRLEHQKLQQAVYEAAQIQRRLCAPRQLAWRGFEIAGESFPVRHLSGDFFKVLELDGVLGLALGDIAGKGFSAGIWQTHLLDLLQRSARACAHPADAIARVNRELCRDAGEPPITALFFARLDPETNDLLYCNAGLPAPLVLRSHESVEYLEEGGPMLGALEEAVYASGHIQLDCGDALLAFSDGLTEARNFQDQEFESRRLTAAAKKFLGAGASQILFSTLAAVLDFADGCLPTDDLSLLVLRRCDDPQIGQQPQRHNQDLQPRVRHDAAGKKN